MKKLLSIICVAVIALTAASCKKETNVITPSRTFFETASNWTTNDGGFTYSVDVPVPEIDNYYDQKGAVLIYNRLNNGEYELLPRVYDGVTYAPTYSGGHIYIDAQDAIKQVKIAAPPTLNLKIVLVD